MFAQLYVAPSLTTVGWARGARVLWINASNVSGSPQAFQLSKVADANSIIPVTLIPGSTNRSWKVNLILQSGETIRVSAGTSVWVTITGEEMTIG